MLTFLQYLAEEQAGGGSLHVFDIDETLFHTDARVHVKDKNGKIVQSLSNQEYNTHKLPPDHHYDYSEFKEADRFERTSHPIHRMIAKVRSIQRQIADDPRHKIIFATARQDFDDKDKFLQFFRNHKIDIDKIHVHRVGNDPGPESPAEKKVKVVRNYINNEGYKKVRMYDDSTANLRAFNNMKKEYPGVKFTSHHVQPSGSTKVYKET